MDERDESERTDMAPDRPRARRERPRSSSWDPDWLEGLRDELGENEQVEAFLTEVLDLLVAAPIARDQRNGLQKHIAKLVRYLKECLPEGGE